MEELVNQCMLVRNVGLGLFAVLLIAGVLNRKKFGKPFVISGAAVYGLSVVIRISLVYSAVLGPSTSNGGTPAVVTGLRNLVFP